MIKAMAKINNIKHTFKKSSMCTSNFQIVDTNRVERVYSMSTTVDKTVARHYFRSLSNVYSTLVMVISRSTFRGVEQLDLRQRKLYHAKVGADNCGT